MTALFGDQYQTSLHESRFLTVNLFEVAMGEVTETKRHLVLDDLPAQIKSKAS